MKTIINEAKTEKRLIQLAMYDCGQFPYVVTYWSRKTAHMYSSSFVTLNDAMMQFEKIKNKK